MERWLYCCGTTFLGWFIETCIVVGIVMGAFAIYETYRK